MRNARLLLVLLWAAVLLAAGDGCRALKRPGIAPPKIPLMVHNNGFFDVDVSAVQSGGGNGARLGTVTGNSTASLSVRQTDLQTGGILVLRLHAIGTNRSWVTPAVSVGPETHPRLDIYSDASGNLSRSVLYTTVVPDTSLGARLSR
jgi:hypothetical protein